MSTKTNMTIRTDTDIKKQAQVLFANLGLDMSTAVNMFLRQAILHQGLPFDISLHRPNQITMQAIKNSYETKETFESVDDLMDSLNA